MQTPQALVLLLLVAGLRVLRTDALSLRMCQVEAALSRRAALATSAATAAAGLTALLPWPLAAVAADEEPIVQVLVQFGEGRAEQKALLRSAGSLVVTGSAELGGKALMGAKVGPASFQLPVMLQLYRANMLDGTEWDTLTASSLLISVKVYSDAEAKGVPTMQGSGTTKYLSSLGGQLTEPVWLPANVVLETTGKT